MKVRLYKGPANGKVIADWRGGDHLIWEGPKKMSREELHRWLSENYNHTYDLSMDNALPRVRAIYRIVYWWGPGGTKLPLQHPDGSIWYIWDGAK